VITHDDKVGRRRGREEGGRGGGRRQGGGKMGVKESQVEKNCVITRDKVGRMEGNVGRREEERREGEKKRKGRRRG
jgi:hypothetical protein